MQDRAEKLANMVAAVTTVVWHMHGPQAARAPIRSQPGPEPLYSQFKAQGLTFNVLYSDDPTLDSYLAPDLFLILPRQNVKVAWSMVRDHRRRVLDQLAQGGGAGGAGGGSAAALEGFVYGGGSGGGIDSW